MEVVHLSFCRRRQRRKRRSSHYGNLTSAWLKGSISPNFVCAAKSCFHTGFGKKIAVQFHQHSASNCTDEICLMYKVKFTNLMRHYQSVVFTDTISAFLIMIEVG